MNPMTAITRGLIAAVPVCLVVVAVVLVRAGTIEGTDLEAVGLGGDTVVGWIGTWVILTLAFGVVATTIYDYLARSWGWSGNDYLSFAVMIAIGLSAVAFLKIYSGEAHPFRIEYSAFNFAYAFGFGYAIPALSAARSSGRLLLRGAGQAAE